MKDAFNENFYVVTATVIPVLYLALFLQVPMVGHMLIAMCDAIDRIKGKKPDSIAFGLLAWAMYYFWMLAGLMGFAILVIGFSGEVTAILALFHQSDDYTDRRFVLFSTVVLLLVTVLTPAWTLSRDWMNSFYRLMPWF